MSSSGGSRDRMEAIKNQIATWWNAAKWADQDAADRAFDGFIENFDAHIDPSLSASANWEIVKQKFNLTTTRDEETEYADRGDELRQRARNAVYDSIDEYGVDEWVRAVNDDPYDEPIPEVAAVRDDILEEFADMGVIPDTLRQWVMRDIEARLNSLGGTFEPETVFDEDEARRIETETRQAVIDELERRYGVRGDDLDDVLSGIESRFRREGGPAVETTNILLRTNADGTWSPAFEKFDSEVFDPYRDEVREQVEREIDIDAALAAAGKQFVVGTIRVEDGELAAIDLSAGRDRFGATGPPAAPAGRGGWNKTSETETRITYEKGEPLTRTEAATRTVLIVEQMDAGRYEGRWKLVVEERTPVDEGDETVASAGVRGASDALPTREAALDVARRYMEDNPFDPDRAAATAGVDVLGELVDRAGGGFENFVLETSDEELREATAALTAGLGGDAARDLGEILESSSPAIVADYLAQEAAQADSADETPLANFLDAVPEFDPPRPSPEQTAGVDARELGDDEQAARQRIRSLLEDGPGDGRDPLAFFAQIEDALRSGDASEIVRLSQRDLDVLSPDLRRPLAEEAARLREQAREADLEPSDFPGVYDVVQLIARQGNEQRVRKAADILEGERANDDTFPQDELERVREVEAVVDAMVDEMWDGYNQRKSQGGRRSGGSSNLGGFQGGQPEPGLSDDDFREYRDSAANYQSGGGGSDGPGGSGSSQPYEDESRLSGTTITRYPAFERQFDQLIRDLGEKRAFEETNMSLYWRLTPGEQREWYDRTPSEWLRLWVRQGRITRSQLYNRGFDESAIPPEEDEEYATRDRREDADPGPLSDRQNTDLTPGERAVRDELGFDDGDDDDVSEGMGSLFGGDDE